MLLIKKKIVKDEISERIRLLYVALTRCKRKMIIVTALKEKAINTENTEHIIDELDRLNYRSFNDILSSCQNYLKDYIKEVDIPLIDEKYKFAKTIDYHNIKQSDEKVLVNEIDYSKNIINESHYSKESNHLVSEEDISNMNYGTKMHYLLETYDFNNPNQNNYNEDEKRIINNLIKSNLFIDYKNAQIFKEYEFISESEAGLKTGIIDLMLVYKDYVDIIDYKLTHTDDSAYSKQLNGYRDYIKHKLDKPVNIYLYSLTEKELIKID
jgi:ATP-dependent helicase/nuclease subunit A